MLPYPPERLHTALSPNGTKVHLATSEAQPICGSRVRASCRVHARVTCPQCRQRRPLKASRRDKRPRVTGVDWSPLYAAVRRALEAGSEMPRVRVQFWPVLATEEQK